MIAQALGWLLLLAPPGEGHHGRNFKAPVSEWIPLTEHVSKQACEADRAAVAHNKAVGGTEEDRAVDEYLIGLELQCVANDDPRLP